MKNSMVLVIGSAIALCCGMDVFDYGIEGTA